MEADETPDLGCADLHGEPFSLTLGRSLEGSKMKLKLIYAVRQAQSKFMFRKAGEGPEQYGLSLPISGHPFQVRGVG